MFLFDEEGLALLNKIFVVFFPVKQTFIFKITIPNECLNWLFLGGSLRSF